MKELRGKNVIVTGGRKGIGRSIVDKFAAEGANIWVCSHTKDEIFEDEMKRLSQRYGVEVIPTYFDLSDEEQIKGFVKELVKNKANIDILVNNAGLAKGGTLGMQSMANFRTMFDINFFAVMYMIQLVQKIMIKQKNGNIINIASVSGCENYGGNIAYGSSKAALIWATKELSKELSPYGIRVNCVSPGTVETDMVQTRTEKQMQDVIERSSLKRMASPEEIADAVLFLASEKSSYITGQNLIVDGGRVNY